MPSAHHPSPVASGTVACPLTPPGEGGISVIEVSGPDALAMVDRLFRSPRGLRAKAMAEGQLLYGTLHRGGEMLDEVILACVEIGPPATVEINCHGGALALKRVLEALLAEGAVTAAESERLARLQRLGRMDRIAVEAAERIPRAPTLLAAGVLLDQYRGALTKALERLAGEAGVGSHWSHIQEHVECLLRSEGFGRGLTDPARVVLAGRPNVGKSTLANALLRFDRVIVHHVPGTTRDTIEEVFAIHGVPFVLVDTAGLREARNEIEREGVLRGKAELGRADVAVLVFDGSQPLQREDALFLDAGLPARVVAAVNKCDLPQVVGPAEIAERTGCRSVQVSGTRAIGIGPLEQEILNAAYPLRPPKGAAVIFTARQGQELREALEAAKGRDPTRFLAAVRRTVNDR